MPRFVDICKNCGLMLGHHMVQLGFPDSADLEDEHRRWTTTIVVEPDEPVWCPSSDESKFESESPPPSQDAEA